MTPPFWLSSVSYFFHKSATLSPQAVKVIRVVFNWLFETKSGVITLASLANHEGRKQYNEPIKIWSLHKARENACERVTWIWFYLWLVGKNGRAFWANHVALRPWQTRTHCCRHKCFPVCPRAKHLLRTQILCRGHKKCFWFCSETFCVRAINVSQFAQPKKHHGQQCVRDNVSSCARAFKWSNQSQLLFDTQFKPYIIFDVLLLDLLQSWNFAVAKNSGA